MNAPDAPDAPDAAGSSSLPSSSSSDMAIHMRPGYQTGAYYILLAGLPFNTTWQNIKDYVRTVAPVDHVEIFRESTSGWVRVSSRVNFYAALDLLNGGILGSKALIVDGRNLNEAVMVRFTSATVSYLYSNMVTMMSPGSSASPLGAGAGAKLTCTGGSPQAQQHSNARWDFGMISALQYGWWPSQPLPAPQQQQQERQQERQQAPGGEMLSLLEGLRLDRPTEEDDDALAIAERRQVIVKGLSRLRVSAQEIRAWVYETAGPELADHICKTAETVPNSRRRGHVFVTFDTEEAARRGHTVFETSKFNLKEVSVSFTHEGREGDKGKITPQRSPVIVDGSTTTTTTTIPATPKDGRSWSSSGAGATREKTPVKKKAERSFSSSSSNKAT